MTHSQHASVNYDTCTVFRHNTQKTSAYRTRHKKTGSSNRRVTITWVLLIGKLATY